MMTNKQIASLRAHVAYTFSGNNWGGPVWEAKGREVLADPFIENGSKFTASCAASAISGHYPDAELLTSDEFREYWRKFLVEDTLRGVSHQEMTLNASWRLR